MKRNNLNIANSDYWEFHLESWRVIVHHGIIEGRRNLNAYQGARGSDKVIEDAIYDTVAEFELQEMRAKRFGRFGFQQGDN